MRLSALLITKNEEQVVEYCIDSLVGFDEIIVCDTGSTDATVEMAGLRMNVQVFTDYKWNDNFAEARNYALSKATGDWCMQIDADHTLLTPVEEVRSIVDALDRVGTQVAYIKLRHAGSGQEHNGAWLFKCTPDVQWVGAIHEVLNKTATVQTAIVQQYGKSPAHALDPDRNLRILRKAEDTPRNRFYLGRELFERNDYTLAIVELSRYLEVATWLPEICEAYLTLARSYWMTGQGDLARAAALDAVRNNPMFKEALLFLGETHYEPWKSRWAKLAEAADNSDVLFVRVT